MNNAGGTAERWTLRASWTLGLLTLVYALNTVDRNLLSLLMQPMKAELGLSDTRLGLLAGFSFSLFYATAALPIAALADRHDRRTIISVGLAFWSVMTGLHALVRNTWQLAAVRFLLGAGEASSVAPATSMVADMFGPRLRPLALGVLTSANSLGMMLAFPVLGAIAQAHGWRAGFIAAGVPGVVLAVLLFLTVREPKRGGADGAHQPAPIPFSQALTAFAGSPAFLLVVTAGLFSSMSLAIMQTWTPSYVARVHHFSLAEVGALLGPLRGLPGLAGALLGGVLASLLARRDPRWLYRVPAFAILLMAPAELLAAFGPSRPLWQFGIGADSFLILGQIGPTFAILQSIAEPRTRARAVAVFLFVSNLVGQSLGPFATGLLSDQLTPALGGDALRWVIASAAFTSILSGAFLLAAGRYLPRAAATA
jgi:MFS family permease